MEGAQPEASHARSSTSNDGSQRDGFSPQYWAAFMEWPLTSSIVNLGKGNMAFAGFILAATARPASWGLPLAHV